MTRLPIITHVCIHVHMLTDMEGHIVELDGYLETEQIELDRWTYFRVSSREFVKDCQGFIQNFHHGGANVTLANVSGGEDFGGTLVLI